MSDALNGVSPPTVENTSISNSTPSGAYLAAFLYLAASSPLPPTPKITLSPGCVLSAK